mgnify:CR=1 FL=1
MMWFDPMAEVGALLVGIAALMTALLDAFKKNLSIGQMANRKADEVGFLANMPTRGGLA